ncbi:MAG: glycosyltransferase family 2 protein [Anaerolineales bacterium]|jgi:cellulose synthase/poly-beta-1,6-N-acetylglucosamine synthase-like glycosyltransferase
MTALILIALGLYGIILALLFIYGLNFYYLSYLAIRNRNSEPEKPSSTDFPPVTVQLPIYNERYVVRRLIDAAAALNYPLDRLQIQVLDDSTDETRTIAAAAVTHHRARGVDIVHIRRKQRTGFKAGALAHGLKSARGDFIAIFDADFLPEPDFLYETIPHFNDSEVGFVQTRWDHLNSRYSLLTRLQALAIDGHFGVEQFARFHGGYFMNFNGTAGVWRRSTIEDAGGWSARTLTEDLDLSYRAQLNGWRPVYLRDCSTKAELPVRLSAYRRQQYRWARGSFETARLMIPRVLRAKLDHSTKLQALLHLTGYGIHALMFLLALIYPAIVQLSIGRPYLIEVFGLAMLFNFTAFAPTLYFTLAQAEMGRNWLKLLPRILFLSVLGSGMMVNNVLAILHSFKRGAGEFERTPKYGIIGSMKNPGAVQYRSRVGVFVLLELGMLAYNLNTTRIAILAGNYIVAAYAGIFASGLLYVLTMTIFQEFVPRLKEWNSGLSEGHINDPQNA